MNGQLSVGLQDQFQNLLTQLTSNPWDYFRGLGCVRLIFKLSGICIYSALPENHTGAVVIEGLMTNDRRLGVFPDIHTAKNVCHYLFQSFRLVQILLCRELYKDQVYFLKPAEPEDTVTHSKSEDWFQQFDGSLRFKLRDAL